MKFARYLQDTQTPEWKKAYIDYRGLKKLITAIKNAQQHGELETLPEATESPRSSLSVDGRARSTSSVHNYGSTGYTPPLNSNDIDATVPPVNLPDSAIQHRAGGGLVMPRARTESKGSQSRPNHNRSKTDMAVRQVQRSRSTILGSLSGRSEAEGQHPHVAQQTGFLANLRRRRTARSERAENLSGRIALPLSVIIAQLPPIERKFIDKLDKELEKVEKFYLERERDARLRAAALKEQLRELEDHRRLFHESKAAETKWKSMLVPRNVADRLTDISMPSTIRGPKAAAKSIDAAQVLSPTSPTSTEPESYKGLRSRSTSPNNTRVGFGRAKLDPDEYKNAKKNLKKAILEYYRGLELLNNYRVLNLTGFRKALKKFEKTVKAPYIQQAYMQEKVEVSAFASGAMIEKLLKDVEDQYADRFEHGNMKKARARLRASAKHKSHHFSTFRSGLYLGLAIPALVDGIFRSFQPEVREKLPWDALLYVYATFMIPVFFALLVGINIWVWNRCRINYQFIFELDVRSQLDGREYFELPALLLATLIYAFWLSFAQIGTSNVASTTWPAIWLLFALVILFNPLPFLFPNARWWLVRKVGRLLVPGTHPVEFTDFWLGDQFCSLIFTLSNLYFVGCVYDEHWIVPFNTCSASIHWGVPFAVGVLPLVSRAVQSVKRYVDSRLYTHLINAGKYCSSILYYAMYYFWRHHNRAHDYTLVLFCIFGTFASIYTCAWDLLMDWSFFKRPAQHRFLRRELVYSGHYYVYYFAIITNIIVRFQWILYIPVSNDGFQLRTFIVGMLEMLRRFQWNFFRLENEHIGNTDQYRVTREVPLPYNFDAREERDESDDDEQDADEEGSGGSHNARFSVKSSWRHRSVRMRQLSSDEEPGSSREP